MKTRNMLILNKLIGLALVGAVLATGASCVDQRDLRTEVYSENVYLPKDFLTRVNPHKPDTDDRAWLYKQTVVKTSTPEYYGYPMVPGAYGSSRYVKFRFNRGELEMLDANELWPIKDNPSATEAVMNTWGGTHVDIQMKVTADGDRTNIKEENRERPWEQRQYFKVDIDKSSNPDMNQMYWWLGDDVNQCFDVVSTSIVPGSFELEQEANDDGDDYVAWTIAVTYRLKLVNGQYFCGNMVGEALDRSTFTYHIKHAFWRVPKSDFKPIEVAEKDPVRKQLGYWETAIMGRLEMFKDPNTEVISGRSYLMRFDPDKEMHSYYFAPGFPDQHKEYFSKDVANQVNALMKEAGVKLRFQFVEHDHDGKVRKIGDPRYSFLAYHQVNAGGLGGLAEMVFDPRTGEVLSATANMYDWVDKLYANLVQDYIADISKDIEADGSTLPTPCKAGEVAKIDFEKIKSNQQTTSLYSKMEQYMEQPAAEWVPRRDADFGKYQSMLLPDLRFAIPWWNTYVGHGRSEIAGKMQQMQQLERQFRSFNDQIDRGQTPFGSDSVLASGSIERGIDAIKKTKDFVRNHVQLQANKRMLRGLASAETLEGWELAAAVIRSGRQCKANGSWETKQEWGKRIVDAWFRQTATHEFGHNLGLRHNFYGSMDKKHMKEGHLSSSIMEYGYTLAEGSEDPLFKPYDAMALKYIYGGEQFKPAPEENWLYCTDEHSAFSPFCTTHDIGTRPTEIVKNEIDMYEFMYKFRNFRTYRKFWNTGYYGSTIINSLYPLRRFLNLWAVDFQPDDIKNDLNLLGVKGDEFFFQNITDEFDDEMAQANRMAANFFKAILQQSAGERSYATKFDNFFGDVTQQGIILDKYYAMFLFVGLWPVDDYDQNIYSSMAYHESSFGNSLYWSNVQDITDSMVGGQYDVYPWFKPLAVLLFSQDTHDVMYSDYSKQKWIEIKRFSRVPDMVDVFGFDPRTEALKVDNPYQTFKDKLGNTWIYYYVVDRDMHLVASKNWNPVAFKILWDQNENINVNKSAWADDYEIKYYLDFYEYFN